MGVRWKSPGVIAAVLAVLLLIQLLPMLAFRYFPTVDGPAHLYNGALIRDFLFNSHGGISKYFRINPYPLPNWSGHLLVAFSGTLLPVWLQEKLLLLLISVGIPLGVVALARSYGARAGWHWLLVLPFVYHLLLYLGFFNFLLSVALLFVLMRRPWVRAPFGTQAPTVTDWLFVLLLYFTHLFGFACLLCFVLLQCGMQVIRQKRIPSIRWQTLGVFVPGLLLAVWFYQGRSLSGFRKSTDSIPFGELLKNMGQGAPLSGLNGAVEVPFASLFAWTVGLLVVWTVLRRIAADRTWQPADALGVFGLLILAGCFVIPNAVAAGGFITYRLLFLSQLFLVAWVLCQPVQLLPALGAALVSCSVVFGTYAYRYQTAGTLSNQVSEVMALRPYVKPGDVFLALNYSDNWLHTNLSNYLSAAVPVLDLDNYEAVQGEFPLLWKAPFYHNGSAGTFAQSRNPDFYPERYSRESGLRITCVLRWQWHNTGADPVQAATDSVLNARYRDKRVSGSAEWYRMTP